MDFLLRLITVLGAAFTVGSCGENPGPVSPDDGGPNVIGDVQATGISTTSVELRWLQVDDGMGAPANYAVGYGSPTIDWESALGSAVSVSGTSIGAEITHTVEGLTPGTTYQFMVAPYRGNFGEQGVFGAPSAALSVTTDEVPGTSEPFFQDNFDSGDKSDANGFSWTSGPPVVSGNGYSGSHALQFQFGPNPPGGDDSAEQRFNLGRNLDEIWIEFRLFVPTNFSHRNDSPSNNKFIRLWGDDYDAINKVGASTWFSSSYASGSSLQFDMIENGICCMGPSGSPSAEFATDDMKGQWTRIRLHFRHVSADNASDAIMRVWFGNTLAINWQEVDQEYSAERPYWNTGYLLGWANSGYTELTTLLVDDVKFFSTNPGW